MSTNNYNPYRAPYLLYTLLMHKYLADKKLQSYAGLIVLYLSGPLFFMATNPESLPLVMLVIPFVWLFVCLFVTTQLVLRNRKQANKRQTVMVSGVVASIPVLLALFQSIHQLSIRDVLLSVGLVVLLAIYMLRADFIK